MRILDHISNPAFDSSLARLGGRLAALPWWHPRRVGWVMMQVGVVLCVCSLLFSVRGVQIGTALAIVGALLAWVPVWRLPVFWFGVAFFLWMALSWMHGRWVAQYPQAPRPQVMAGVGVLFYWTLLPLGVVVFSRPAPRLWALWGLAATLIAVVVQLLAQMAVGKGAGTLLGIDPTGPRWGQPLGVVIGSSIPCVLTTGMICAAGFLWMISDSRDKVPAKVRWVAAGMAALAAVLLAERSPVLGLLAGLVGLGIWSHSWRQRLVVLGVLIGVTAAALWFLHAFRPDAFSAMFRGDDERLKLWQCGRVLIGAHPWLGVGCEPAMYPAMQVAAEHLKLTIVAFTAHNLFLSVAGTYGLPALLGFIVFLGGALWRAAPGRRGVSPCQDGWRMAAAITACMLAAGWFNDLPDDAAGISVFYLALAWAASRPGEPSAPTNLSGSIHP